MKINEFKENNEAKKRSNGTENGIHEAGKH